MAESSESSGCMPSVLYSYNHEDKGDSKEGDVDPHAQTKSIVVLGATPEEENIPKNSEDKALEEVKDRSEIRREIDELKHNFSSILNKITSQRFKELISQMLQLNVNSLEKLELTSDLIFEKAVTELDSSNICGNISRLLANAYRITLDDDPSKVVTFRKLLLNKCQREFENQFEKCIAREKSIDIDEDKCENKEVTCHAIPWEKKNDTITRKLGLFRFIGELFKFQMLSENVMHDIIFKLLSAKNDDCMECFCVLMTNAGKALDHQRAKRRMDQYFAHMKKYLERRKNFIRVMQDTIDLRENKWIPSRMRINEFN